MSDEYYRDKFPNYAPIGVPKIIKDNSKKPPFDAECVSEIKHVAPGTETHAQFDWSGLAAYLGEPIENVPPDHRELFARFLADAFHWITSGDDLKVIGRRAVAFAWTMNPSIFDGEAVTKLATKYGYARSALCADTAEVRRRFKIQNHSQDHAWNFREDGGDPTKN